MAKKFVDADEAAKMLGISVDALTEMRDRHEVFPVRDGGQWKYKFDEVERLVTERAEGGGSGEENYDDAGGMDSILLSELELGQTGPGSSTGTVIGKNEGKNAPGAADSDIQLTGAKPPKNSGSLSHFPESPSELPDMGSDVFLAAESSDIQKAGSGLSKKFDALDTLDLELPPALSSSGTDADRVLKKKDDSGILSLDDNSLSLGEEPRSKLGLGGSSSKRRAAGSAIDLSGNDDDDLVLGSAGSGSDLTHSGGDSGISLIDPSDSGLQLDDDALEAQGTNAPTGKTSLNLGGGDDDLILLEEEGDPNVATQLKADDDFLLTPMDDEAGQESDSGSQVIALDQDSDFDEHQATMIGGRVSGAGLLEPDSGDFGGGGFGGGGFAEAGGAPALALAPGGMPMPQQRGAAMMMEAPEVIEAPFSVFTVILLLMCVLVLVVGGMMSYDLLRNMWSWDSTYRVNSSLMDGILDMFEK